MTADPRAALETLVAALERHLELAASRRDADDPAVGAAAEAVIEAFDDYDEALFDTTGVATPLGVYSDEDEEDEDEDEDEPADPGDLEDAGAGMYAGLDVEDIDFDDEESDEESEDDE
ncbi:MAG: hypothetical protein WCG47_20005 [Dermatophilaceae bacterium]